MAEVRACLPEITLLMGLGRGQNLCRGLQSGDYFQQVKVRPTGASGNLGSTGAGVKTPELLFHGDQVKPRLLRTLIRQN